MNIPESIEFKNFVEFVLKDLKYPAIVMSQEEGYVEIPNYEEMLEIFVTYYWNTFDRFYRDDVEYSNMSDEEYFNFVDEKAMQNVHTMFKDIVIGE